MTCNAHTSILPPFHGFRISTLLPSFLLLPIFALPLFLQAQRKMSKEALMVVLDVGSTMGKEIAKG